MKKKIVKAFWIFVEFYGKPFIFEEENGTIIIIGHPYLI